MDKLSMDRCIGSRSAAPRLMLVSLLLVILMHSSLASAQEDSSHAAVSSSAPVSVEFPAGSIILKAGQSKITSLGKLVMQWQGNLVFYDKNGKPLWGSNKHEKQGENDFKAGFQGDGNLVIYRGSKSYWATKTAGHPNARLVLSTVKPYLSIIDKTDNLCIWSAINQDSDATQISSASASPVIRYYSPDGQIVCAAGSSCSQIPGQTDLFVSRGCGIGSLDYCHQDHPALRNFLALFRMDWKANKMVMMNYLLKPPDKPQPGITTPTGIYIAGAYDPYVASYHGELWVAFEAIVPGSCSTCIAPLTPDMKGLDLSRLTLVAKGTELKSASAPVLLNFRDHLYVYWTIDYKFNKLPKNTLVTRGMELKADSHGRLWGARSGGRSVATDDPRLTSLVHDVDVSDTTANHLAGIWGAIVVGRKILVTSYLGGTAGNEVCCSGHQRNPGCWRMAVSVADAPLGANVFGKKIVDLPSLPDNAVSYARVIVDPSGRKLLLALFDPPNKMPGTTIAHPHIETGVRYIPFDSLMTEALQAH